MIFSERKERRGGLDVLFAQKRLEDSFGFDGVVAREFLQKRLNRELLLFFTSAIEDDSAFLHHDKAVAIGNRILHVVGYHQRRNVVVVDDLIGQFHHRFRGFWVEGGRMLIEQEKLGRPHRRHEEGDRLSLPARETADFGIESILQPEA